MDKAEEAVLDSRVRSRSFNNSSSRKDGDCRCVCANKSYSLESIQPRRWRPCQLLREVFARTPLLFGRRSNDSSVPDRPSVIMTPAEESSITFSSEDSGHCESPSSLSASVVVFMDGQHLQPPKARRSCSADSAVDLDASPSAQQHRTSLPQGDRRRPLAQCLSLSCPALSAPSVVVSDYSGGESNGGESPELPDEASGCVSADDLRDYLSLGRSCSTCSLSSTISSISWDDEASHSDVSEASTCASPKPSAWRKVRNVVHWSPFVQTYRKYKYPWIQLAGHQGNFRSGTQGTILKKLCGKEESCLKQLMRDPWLRDYVPEFKGRVDMDDGSVYLELQDLLAGFQCPCVMDIKVGLRTYLEEELAKAREKPKLRKDMYEKMVAVDPDEPTLEEHDLKAVTKPRYMIWRETISSTASLGFRIEGIKNPDGTSTKDFKTTKSRDQVMTAIDTFTKGFDDALGKYLQRLRTLYDALEHSEFFSSHEFIGSSLLFVHDRLAANVSLIDFAKTVAVPAAVTISHRAPWEVGNHEDGYLIGLSNLIGIFEELLENRCGGYSKSLPPEIPA